MALIIDVETTGLPHAGSLKLPFGEFPSHERLSLYDSARVVQVTLMLCNERFEEVELRDFIVQTDGFTIENASFHGITDEIAAAQGVPFAQVADTLSAYLHQVSHVVAHNAAFDLSILKSELYRAGRHSLVEQLASKRVLCTMKHTQPIVKAKNKRGYVKFPSLAELFTFVFHSNLENAHNAKYDVINLHRSIKSLYDDHNRLCFYESLVYLPC